MRVSHADRAQEQHAHHGAGRLPVRRLLAHGSAAGNPRHHRLGTGTADILAVLGVSYSSLTTTTGPDDEVSSYSTVQNRLSMTWQVIIGVWHLPIIGRLVQIQMTVDLSRSINYR